MKVYAHFKATTESADGFQYRWRTLLQFGNSWEIIGSVVMKNPGSAHPLVSPIAENTRTQLQHIDNKASWYEFTADATMGAIGKLFAIFCYNQRKPLNGVVQIFNLFNIRQADLGKALKQARLARESIISTWETDRELLNGAIYLGWGDLGKNPHFQEQAHAVFEQIKKAPHHYLADDFDSNRFYHPLYLVVYGARETGAKQVLADFCQQEYRSDADTIQIPNLALNGKEIASAAQQGLAAYGLEHFSNDSRRFMLSPLLQITIAPTSNSGGYVGIRHQSYRKKYIETDYPNTERYRMELEELGYHTTEPVWLGTKQFKEYGYSNEEVIDAIIKETRYLQQRFKEKD